MSLEPTPLTLDGPKKKKLINYLTTSLSHELEKSTGPPDKQHQHAIQLLEQICKNINMQLPTNYRDEIFQEVVDAIFNYGPIQAFLNDPEVDEIMVNGFEHIYIERKGKIIKTDVVFENDEHVIKIIESIISPLGRRIDSGHPTVDGRLPDGSRINAVIPPVAVDGPSITIRKFRRDKLNIKQLVEYGTLSDSIAKFIEACVVARLNLIISGGTGSGKTTLLNILSGFIPSDERIVTIEDAAELQLRQEHIVRLEAKPNSKNGDDGVTIRDLVRNALRMRPDRIVVGEVRGGEALDMLQAMNTGHDGSMTTLHANAPRDALSRLETITLMSGLDLPIRVIREQIASAIDLIVQQSRMCDGTRKVTRITEVIGMEGDTIVLSDIFKFEQNGLGEDGKVLGEHKATGIRPIFMNKLESAGFKLGPEVFGINIAELLAANRNPSNRRR
jgi:pilus assembly protein CpaF